MWWWALAWGADCPERIPRGALEASVEAAREAADSFRDSIRSQALEGQGDRLAGIVFGIDPDLRLNDFTIGLLDTSNVIYFVSLTGLFLLATIASLQGRRCQ